MLTKDDLEQLSKLMDQKLEPITKELQTLKNNDREMKKDIKTMLNLLDGEQMRQRKRIDRIEEHLGLPHPA